MTEQSLPLSTQCRTGMYMHAIIQQTMPHKALNAAKTSIEQKKNYVS